MGGSPEIIKETACTAGPAAPFPHPSCFRDRSTAKTDTTVKRQEKR